MVVCLSKSSLSPAEEGGLWTELFVAERDGKGEQHHDDEPPRRDSGPESNTRRETGRGTDEVSQEVVTAAILDALSNPDIIRRLLAVVSPGGPSDSDSLTAASGGEWLSR